MDETAVRHLTFECHVSGKPEPAGSKRSFLHPRTGRLVVVDDNPASKRWKKRVAAEAKYAANGNMLGGAIRLSLTFYLTRPKGHRGRKGLRPSAPDHHIVRPDVLKLARAVEDALTGVVYGDDAQIVEEILVKRYDERDGVHIFAETL